METDGVSTPTEYDRVQKRQYTGQTDDAELLGKLTIEVMEKRAVTYQGTVLCLDICEPTLGLESQELHSRSRGLALDDRLEE